MTPRSSTLINRNHYSTTERAIYMRKYMLLSDEQAEKHMLRQRSYRNRKRAKEALSEAGDRLSAATRVHIPKEFISFVKRGKTVEWLSSLYNWPMSKTSELYQKALATLAAPQ